MSQLSINPFRLDGRIALVTGAASGIGIGIATVLAEAGATIVIADRDRDGAAQAADTLTAAGHHAHWVYMDLTDEASIVTASAEVVSRIGTPWILVNNAGLQDRELLLEGTAEEWDRTNAVNVRGPYFLIREVARAMVAKGDGGRIVNIASTALRGQFATGHGPYLASKGGLAGLSQAAALELIDHRITANTVLPGGVITPGSMGVRGPKLHGPATRMPPLGLCDPRDIGAAVYFFASPAAHRITNQWLAVDGGFSVA